MQIIDNIPVWGSQVDEGALKQIRTCYWIFGQAAMMADHHKGCAITRTALRWLASVDMSCASFM